MPANQTLQKRLFILTTTLGVSLVVIMSVIFVSVEFTHLRRQMTEHTEFVAGLLGAEIGTVPAAEVTAHAKRLMTALDDYPLIDLACVYDSNDRLIATHEQHAAGGCAPSPERAEGVEGILLNKLIVVNEQRRGSLQVHSSRRTIYRDMGDLLLPLALIITGLVIIVVVTGRHFALLLVNPIIELTSNAKRLDPGAPTFESVDTELREVAELSESFKRVVENLDSARHSAEGEVVQRRAAEDAERASRELLRHIVDLVPYLIFAVHRNGTILFANQAVADLYEEPLSCLLEPGFKDSFRSAETDQLLFAPFSTTRGPDEVWFTDSVGESRRFLVRWVPYIGDDSALVIGADVTEEHRLQLQLQFSQRLEVIGTLAGGIAHDFNNLLTPILGYTSMLLDSDLPEEVIRKLQAVEAAAERARDVVLQILTFSRQQKSPQEKVPTDVATVVEEAADLMRATIPSTVQIRIKEQPVGQVRADPNQIHQVVVNLVTNARQAISGPAGLVDIRVFPVRPDSLLIPPHLAAINYVCIEIEDNGIGIESDVISHIFEPFFTTKDVGEGSGLGLSVVHGIVTGHGGDITVESREGEGSVFRVLLPRADSDGISPEVSDGGVVMLVDDEDSVLRVTSELLSSQGYDVTTFNDPTRAINELGGNPKKYEVLVTDHNMPEMTGAQLAAAARQIRPDIPIILITGFASAAASELEGIDHTLMKPVSGRELSLVIQSSLATRRPAA
ncbi:MAG: ATP-binding protein [Gammaproteobacteria bacterium]|nr:ATP-binding protein [Gammaproteobacteria bacterium]